MRLQLRIVAGKWRGRKLSCRAAPHLRPTPEMVRQALFSILGDAVPGRVFLDVFAGSGVVGLEAHSRGAGPVIMIERDVRLANEITRHLQLFQAGPDVTVLRADAYRWVKTWEARKRLSS